MPDGRKKEACRPMSMRTAGMLWSADPQASDAFGKTRLRIQPHPAPDGAGRQRAARLLGFTELGPQQREFVRRRRSAAARTHTVRTARQGGASDASDRSVVYGLMCLRRQINNSRAGSCLTWVAKDRSDTLCTNDPSAHKLPKNESSMACCEDARINSSEATSVGSGSRRVRLKAPRASGWRVYSGSEKR